MDVQLINQWFRDAKTHSSDWREKAVESFKYYSNKQWSEEDKARMNELERPIVTFNRTAPVINAVAGFEVSNRQEIRYIPRTLDDSGGNEMYTNVAKWARDETDADDEQSDAFKDAVICGMGWTDTSMNYEDNPDGIPTEVRFSPLEAYWDPSARRQNLADARYVIRKLEVDKLDMDAQWPGMSDEIINETLDMDDFQEPHNADPQLDYKGQPGFNKTTKKFIVLHTQWWEKKPYYRVFDPLSQEILEFSAERFEKIKPLMGNVQAVKQLKKVYYRMVSSGETVLTEKTQLSVQGEFTLQCITGFRDESDNTFYGIMEAMKDPQNWANKFFSQFLDIVNSNAKGGLIAEQDAFADIRKAEEQWAAANSIVWLNEGGMNKVKEKQQQPVPQGTDRLLQIAVGATRDVTGINMEFLGLANREQAGILETERKRSALVILADIFNSHKRFKRKQGRVLLQMIHKNMREGQLIRIVGQEGAQYVPFARQPKALTYDVIVDTAPDSPNMKQETWAILQNILPAIIKAGISVPPDIIRFLPIPESVASKWMEHISQQTQPSPEQQAAQQLEMQDKQAEIDETKSKTQLNLAKAENINSNAEAQVISTAIKSA